MSTASPPLPPTPGTALRDWLAGLARVSGRTGRTGWLWPAALVAGGVWAAWRMEARMASPGTLGNWPLLTGLGLMLGVSLRRLRDAGLPVWARALPFVLIAAPPLLMRGWLALHLAPLPDDIAPDHVIPFLFLELPFMAMHNLAAIMLAVAVVSILMLAGLVMLALAAAILPSQPADVPGAPP